MNQLNVRQHMQTALISLKADHKLADAISLLEADTQPGKHLRCAVVTDDQGQLLGTISKKDFLKPLLNSSYYCEGAPNVGEFMNRGFTALSPDDSIIEVANRIAEQGQQSFPVVENGQLLGLLTTSDVISALNQHYLSCQVG